VDLTSAVKSLVGKRCDYRMLSIVVDAVKAKFGDYLEHRCSQRNNKPKFRKYTKDLENF
jgi:hypothetical protein